MNRYYHLLYLLILPKFKNLLKYYENILANLTDISFLCNLKLINSNK
jgi:hypothetical protein